MIAVNLKKQKALDPDPKATHKINFTRNLARDSGANTTMFFYY